MLKPLTLSLSFAVALGFCSVSMAGMSDGCTTCGLASPQAGPTPSAQCPVTPCQAACAPTCAPKKCGLGGRFGNFCNRMKCSLHPPVCYEWVLKKKRLWGHKGGGCAPCGGAAPCGAAPVYPTGQVTPSGQGGYAAPSGQGGYAAPQAAPVYGAGQQASLPGKPAPTIASVPAEMTPAVAGDEAPPAPEVRETSGLLLPTPSGN